MSRVGARRSVWKTSLLVSAGLAALAVSALIAWQVAVYDREGCLADFAALKERMARSYANLDWMVDHRGVDLPELSRRTESALRSARTRWQARLALASFVREFRDPHLRVETLKTGPAAGSDSPPPPPPRDCDDLGYEKRDRGFVFPFPSATGWRPIGGELFPAGLWGDVGILRIAHFGEDGYVEVCREVFSPDEPRTIRLRVRARLMEEIRRTMGALREAGARTLLVDVTGNGGGTEWVVEVVKLLAPGSLRRQGARRVEARCDRTSIWEGAPVCTALGDPEETMMEGEGIWPGPVVLLVDGRSASATEDLIVWLKENGAARVIGERTLGAGCGYVDGGDPADLPALGLRVRMPNCARFLSDGTNEIEGIDPDVHVPVRQGPAARRIEALRKALTAAPGVTASSSS